MSTLVYILLSIAIVSLISLIGISVFLFKHSQHEKLNTFLIGLSIGALLSAAFVHLLPEAYHELDQFQSSLTLLIGFVVFFIFERFLQWRLKKSSSQIKVFGPINLIADFFHNFLDGVIIAVAYSMDIHAGIAATIAIILHEIPQEFGDFGVLVKAGYTAKKALFYNLLTSLSSFLGAALILLLPKPLKEFTPYLLPISVSAFVYLALNNLMPELQRNNKRTLFFIQLAGILTGMILLFVLFAMNSGGHHHH